VLRPAGQAIGFRDEADLPPAGLKGIKAITVDAVSIPSPLTPGADESIQAAVADRLAAAGVPVFSADECAAREDCAYLDIRVRTLTSKSGALVIFVVEASVPQPVKLVRDPSIELGMGVATYRDVEFGVAPSGKALAVVSDAAVELARRFAVIRTRENR